MKQQCGLPQGQKKRKKRVSLEVRKEVDTYQMTLILEGRGRVKQGRSLSAEDGGGFAMSQGTRGTALQL